MKGRRALAVILTALGVVVVVVASVRLVRERSRGSDLVQPQRGLNVLLITIDTMRADHLGCLGGSNEMTPTLDGLARHGILFEQATAVAPVTLPSHASMLTGLLPPHHGIRNNGMFALPDDVQTLATVFGKAGYRTGAFVSAAILARKYGLARDFDIYDDDLSKGRYVGGAMVPSRTGDVTVEAALSWLEKLPSRGRFFCWVHLYDPHQPYLPPPELARRFPDDPYGAEIAFADSQVGRLLQALDASGRLERTVVAVAADHGEALGEHHEQTHGVLLHQATLHVPLILAGPVFKGSARIDTPVSGADVAPTLAALVKVRPPNARRLDGRSLLPLIEGQRERFEGRPIYSETLLPHFQYGWSGLRSVREGQWELVLGARPELFDLRADPRELVDLSGREQARAADLARVLEGIDAPERGVDSLPKLALSRTELEQLRSLGYLGSETAPRRNPPDPRDLIGAHVHMERARQLAFQGRPQDALRELNAMLAEDPDNVSALTLRAQLLASLSRNDAARSDLEHCLRIDPDNAEVYAQLARVELAQGHPKSALELARIGATKRGAFETLTVIQAKALTRLHRKSEAVALVEEHLRAHPDDPDLLTARAVLEMADGKLKEAEKLLRKAVSIDALHRRARQELADLLDQQGRTAEAIEIYRQLLRIQPDNPVALAAVGRFQLNDPEVARPYLEEAVRLDPGRWRPMVSLGVCYARLGQFAKAEAMLRRALAKAPSDPAARNSLAAVLCMRGKDREAEKILRELIVEGHDSAAVRNNLALVLARTDRVRQAEREAKKALQLDPASRDAVLTLSSILHKTGRYDEEAAALEPFTRSDQTDPNVAARYGLALEAQGKRREALPWLEKAVEAFPSRPDLLLALARSEEAVGELDAARSHFEQAAELAPEGELREGALSALERLAGS